MVPDPQPSPDQVPPRSGHPPATGLSARVTPQPEPENQPETTPEWRPQTHGLMIIWLWRLDINQCPADGRTARGRGRGGTPGARGGDRDAEGGTGGGGGGDRREDGQGGGEPRQQGLQGDPRPLPRRPEERRPAGRRQPAEGPRNHQQHREDRREILYRAARVQSTSGCFGRGLT